MDTDDLLGVVVGGRVGIVKTVKLDGGVQEPLVKDRDGVSRVDVLPQWLRDGGDLSKAADGGGVDLVLAVAELELAPDAAVLAPVEVQHEGPHSLGCCNRELLGIQGLRLGGYSLGRCRLSRERSMNLDEVSVHSVKVG